MNAICETDFVDFSYGFRPGRNPRGALDALTAGILWKKVNWVLDADICDFFTRLDHGWLPAAPSRYSEQRRSLGVPQCSDRRAT